jgi:hypothetical protein
MPTANEILDGLRAISNNYILISIYWHMVIYFSILLLLLVLWRPTNRMSVLLLSLPFITVALLAWFNSNPFNGVLFSILSIYCLITGLKLSQKEVKYSPWPYRIAGILLLLFGLWYPHFIEADSVWVYLYSAPSGLIPCPTLSIAIGIALIFNGFNSNPLKIIFLFYGFFYSLFGILKLGVYLDVVLLLGTLVFLIQFQQYRRQL